MKPVDYILECDETCEIKQRASRLAIAFDLNQDVSPTNDSWPPEVILAAKNHSDKICMIETILADLVSNPKYYNFSTKYSRSFNHLIISMCKEYGFEAQVVDEKWGKPNVSIYSIINPRIPPKTLSAVLKELRKNPLDLHSKISTQRQNNGLYVKIQEEFDLSAFKEELGQILYLGEKGFLLWMDDYELLMIFQNIHIPRIEIAEKCQENPLEADFISIGKGGKSMGTSESEGHFGNAYETLLKLVSDRLYQMGVVQIEDCYVSAMGVIHFQGKTGNIKNRNRYSFRIAEGEWTTSVASWLNLCEKILGTTVISDAIDAPLENSEL
jgi:hypothetical protein